MKNTFYLFVILIFAGCSQEGKPLRPFQMKTINGQNISSENLKNKVVVIQIWATWCGTCISEIPALNRIKQKYENNPEIVFIALCNDPEYKVKSSLARFPFIWEQVADAGDYISSVKTRIVKTYPQTIIADQKQIVRLNVTESANDVSTLIDQKIQALIKSH